MSKTCDVAKRITVAGAIKVASLLKLEQGWFLFYWVQSMWSQGKGARMNHQEIGNPKVALSPGMWQPLDSEKKILKMGVGIGIIFLCAV